MNSFSWITRSSFAWVSIGMLPISSKKIEPLSASSNSPFLLATAPVKAPRTWPKRLLSSRSAGIEPELTVTNGPPRAPRVVVDGLGHQLLARAALAEHEDVALRRRREPDELEDLLHRLALADDVVEGEALPELLLERAVLGREPPLLQPLADGEQHLLVLERLGDVVERPLAHGLDGALDRRVGGDDHHHQVGVVLADLPQHLQAVHAGEHEVEQDQVDLLALQHGERLLAGGGGRAGRAPPCG